MNVEPRSNNAISAGLSSYAGYGNSDPGRDVVRCPEKAKPTDKKLRAKDRPLANDFVSDDEFNRLLHEWFGNLARVLLPGRAFYIWGGYGNCGSYPPVLKACELYFSQAIIWVKEHPVLTRKDYMGNHEWAFYGWREGAAHVFVGPNNAYAPDHHVVIDDDQLDQLRAPADRALCLEHFIDADDFEPALFAGRSLYLMPDGMVANYPYAVLSAALRERKKWAIGRVVLSSQRRLVLVRPGVTTLSMHVLHYPAQVRPVAALGTAPAISDAEKDLASQLIDAQSQPLNWSEYRDDRAEQLAVLVQAAIEQRPLTPAPAAAVPMLPLLEALRKSVAAIPTAASLPRINGATHPRQRTAKRSPVRRRA